LVPSYDEITVEFDAVVVTDVVRARASLDAAIESLGEDRVFVPELLGLKVKLAGQAGGVL
jgi:hypothetical protein